MFDEIERETILEPDETARISQAIAKADIRYQHMPDIIMIGLNTAMRLGEILEMERKWIDLKAEIINVPRYSQKRGKKNKRVPINSAIRPIIVKLLNKNKGHKHLIVNPKTGTRYTKVQHACNHILKDAGLYGKPGVDKLRLHDLRHTAATNLARAGKDIKFIAQYLGHSDVKTSAKYIHYSDEDLKNGAETLAQVPSNFTTLKVVFS
jgi:integrase